jgi:hypothetical protein
VEQEVVDQINIVSDWLRRRSGEGRHLVLPESTTDPAAWRAVGAWLKQAAPEVAAGCRAAQNAKAARGSQLVLAEEISGEQELGD